MTILFTGNKKLKNKGEVMETKIRDMRSYCPPDKIHYIRYITKNGVATTLCDETINTKDWEYIFNSKVDCPACIIATIKREKIIKKSQRKENMSTKFCLALGIIVVFAALYTINCLFSTF